MTRENAVDLWRARFGYRWTTSEEAAGILEDPDWRKILFLCRTAQRITTAYPAPSDHCVYTLTPDKDSNGNS